MLRTVYRHPGDSARRDRERRDRQVKRSACRKRARHGCNYSRSDRDDFDHDDRHLCAAYASTRARARSDVITSIVATGEGSRRVHAERPRVDELQDHIGRCGQGRALLGCRCDLRRRSTCRSRMLGRAPIGQRRNGQRSVVLADADGLGDVRLGARRVDHAGVTAQSLPPVPGRRQHA